MRSSSRDHHSSDSATNTLLKHALRARTIGAGIVPSRPDTKEAYLPGGVHAALRSRSAIARTASAPKIA